MLAVSVTTPWLWYADNAQDVDVSYETICVLDWLPSNAVSLVFSKKLSMYVAHGGTQGCPTLPLLI